MIYVDDPEVGARKEWLAEATAVIRDVCDVKVAVTTHDIWPLLVFPPRDGRLLGKALKKALTAGWLEKDKDPNGCWRAWDHTDLDPVFSADGVLIKQKSLIPVYRSLICPGARNFRAA